MTSPAINKENNFDFLRLFFALYVVLHHSDVLSGISELRMIKYFVDASFALNSFFIVSGFLVSMSYERSASVSTYFRKRFRRIYPAYFAAIILCAILGVFVSSLSWDEYYLSKDTLLYILVNLVFMNFLHPGLPGVFENNHINAVNGSLWTIRTEIVCYMLVPFLAKLSRRTCRFIILIGAYVLGYFLYYFLSLYGELHDLVTYKMLAYMPWHFLFFLSGAAMYYYYEYFSRKPNTYFLISLLLYPFIVSYGLTILKPILLASIIIWIACFFQYGGNFGKYGDLSYGSYIFHFPILQVMISYRILIDRPFVFLLVSLTFILAFAFLSWHLIEKPFLQRSSHYVIASDRSRDST